MRRGRDVIGIPVIETGTSRALGTVTDLFFRPDGTVSALLVAPSKGLLRRAVSVPIERFDSIRGGRAHVDRSAFSERKDAPAAGVTARVGLCGKNLITREGKELGIIADVVLDGPGIRSNGAGALKECPIVLWGFEISDGIVKDLLDGRPVVEAAGAILDGNSVILDAARKHMNLAAGGHDTREGSE